jgi:hypothetical protein
MDRDEFDRWAEERRARRRARDERRWEELRRAGESPRKERVMHTRISEDLDESLRRTAEELRVPVSNLVRNVLEDVFTVVETVTDNVGDLVDDLIGEADRVRKRVFQERDQWKRERRDARSTPRNAAEVAADREARRAAEAEIADLEDLPPFQGVVGWQSLVMNAAQQCSGCGRDMQRGDRAFMGIDTDGRPKVYVCTECLRGVSEP